MGTSCFGFLSACQEAPLSALAPASDVTRSVSALWWVMAAGTAVILVLMVVLATLAIRKNRPMRPRQRGVRMMLVAGGLLLPGGVIAALLAYGLRVDEAQWPPMADREAEDAFHVDVIARQWSWEARYPDQEDGTLRTFNVLHVPAGIPVHVRIMAADVIHGFWVPRIAGKLDAVPGRVNRIRLFVDEPGEYAGICAEYCGDGHTHMRFTLIAHPPALLTQRLAEAAHAAQQGGVPGEPRP